MIKKINNLYDSHVHFKMTGEQKSRLDLSRLKSSLDLKALSISKNNYQGPWLVGFGWDEYQWSDGVQNLNKNFLDQIFPDAPVVFSRKDGHKAWVNSMALKMCPEIESSDQCLKNENGSTGILLENAHYAMLRKIPSFSREQTREHLLQAQNYFLQNGFTHLRDLSSSFEQINILQELVAENQFKIFVKSNFVCDHLSELDNLLTRIEELKEKLKKASQDEGGASRVLNQILIEGVKIFYDGSLGSETALLSQPYGNEFVAKKESLQKTQNQKPNSGVRLWDPADLELAIEKIWKKSLAVSIHVIGDQAVDEVVDIARKVSARGVSGSLNLEHVQVTRPETIAKMKSLHITCHMQPCHFLSDQYWLKEKLGSLVEHVFPWERLRRAKIPFYFGSDAPIESASVFRNHEALLKSAQFGISKLEGDWTQHHQILNWNGGASVPDAFGVSELDTYTILDIDNEKILEVWIRGNQVI